MKVLILFVGWCLLAMLSWPVALLALVLAPLVWLLSLPFRLLGLVLEALLAIVRALLILPAPLLGAGPLASRAGGRPPSGRRVPA